VWNKLFIIISALLVSQPAFAIVDIVLDLDKTCVGWVSPRRAVGRTDLIQVGEEYYRVYEGVIEFIRHFSKKKKDFRINFFSGREERRNLDLLSKIMITPRVSARKLAYRIISGEELVNHKKDLTVMWPRAHLDSVVLVDDNTEFIAPGQSRNFLKVEEEIYRLHRPWMILEKALIDSKKHKVAYADVVYALQWSTARFRCVEALTKK